MELFKIILLEYLLGYILQGFALIIGVYAFNREKVNVRRYFLISVAFIVISYIMRQLPINFGVHTILDMICMFIIFVLYLKMPAFATIKSLLVITVSLIATELINVLTMTTFLGKDKFNNMMSSSPNKYIVGLPAALLFAFLMVLAYYFLAIKKKDGEKRGKTGP